MKVEMRGLIIINLLKITGMTSKELPQSMAGIMAYAMREEEVVFNGMAAKTGYTRKTTFFSDLSIAECYGGKGIKDTYNRVVNSWLNDVVYFTEFVMSLNWKSWEWAEREGGTSKFGKLYSELFYKAQEVGYDTFKGDDAEYFWRTLD